MKKYTEIEGDLITLAKEGMFDVIIHGVNCFNTQGAGIALAMRNNFSTDKFQLEDRKYYGDYNKLGQIDWELIEISSGNIIYALDYFHRDEIPPYVSVVNCYTQFNMGRNLDYTALQMCLNKLNHEFAGQHIGVPLIGCGIAGGDWNIVSEMIANTLTDLEVTVVKFKK